MSQENIHFKLQIQIEKSGEMIGIIQSMLESAIPSYYLLQSKHGNNKERI